MTRGDAKKERKIHKRKERGQQREKRREERGNGKRSGEKSLCYVGISAGLCECPCGITASLRVSDPGGSQRKHSGISSICYRSHRSVLCVVGVSYTEI